MQQQPKQSNGPISRTEYEARHSEISAKFAQIEARYVAEIASIKADSIRQFERLLDEIKGLRKELVAQDALKNVELQIRNSKEDIEELKREQISRTERFWMRFGPLIALGVGIIALIEFVSRIHLVP